MVYVGIDVAKNKHDCFAMSSEGEILFENFTIQNTLDGFNSLLNSIFAFEKNFDKIKVGLEATGHYSNNIVNFLTNKGFSLYLLNPLQTNLFRKTKTDKLDARFIATLLISGNLKSYSKQLYHVSELKSLVRHRFRLVHQRSKCKVSFSRLLTILFPELESAVWSTSQKSALYLLLELPSAKHIADCHLTHLTSILKKYSNGMYGKEKTLEIRELAKNSIGCTSYAQSFEMQQVIQSILFYQSQINEIDKQLKKMVKELDTPLLTIPGISYVSAAFILAEIGDINNFDSPAKLQAFAGLDPSTYQSGQYTSTHVRMVKRGSKYLRWALLNASRLVCMRDETFNNFKNQKLKEGKHFFVALSHVTKKLIRVIFHLLKTGESYQPKTNLSNVA